MRIGGHVDAHLDPVELAGLLDSCSGVTRLDLTTLGRATWQRPSDVIESLEISEGSRVADLGAGDGYFLPYLREAVGLAGRVYAVEVDAELNDELEERFGQRYDNVDVVLGGYDDPLLPDGAIDLVLIVNTYHHIEERTAYFRRLRRDLAPGARIAIIDPNADVSGLLRLFLDDGHMSHASQIAREMEQAGYRRSASLEILPIQVFELFSFDDEQPSR